MTKIIVKEIDRFYSRKKGKNYISEYLIYINIDGKNIACREVLGQTEKSLVVTEYLVTHFETIPNIDDVSNYVEEITNYKQ
jgi:hypothetical protein